MFNAIHLADEENRARGQIETLTVTNRTACQRHRAEKQDLNKDAEETIAAVRLGAGTNSKSFHGA